MSIALTRSGTVTGAVLPRAAAPDSSDEMLVERIAAGEKLAMQVLFARHRTNIYRWLLRFVGNETVAEDLLSDVFFDVWQQTGCFEGRAAVTTWLLSIARFTTVEFNPPEGFVFGAAVLLHDAGMTLAAYPGGLSELKKNGAPAVNTIASPSTWGNASLSCTAHAALIF